MSLPEWVEKSKMTPMNIFTFVVMVIGLALNYQNSVDRIAKVEAELASDRASMLEFVRKDVQAEQMRTLERFMDATDKKLTRIESKIDDARDRK